MQPCLTLLLMANQLESLLLMRTHDFGRDADEFQYFTEGCVVNRVKGSLEVNASDVKVATFMELPGFFNNESEDRNVVSGGAIWHKPSLWCIYF